jgi:hypothetical protein
MRISHTRDQALRMTGRDLLGNLHGMDRASRGRIFCASGGVW